MDVAQNADPGGFMQHRPIVAIWAIAIAVCLSACQTIYHYDVAGNLTCTGYGIPGPSTFTVAPPVITNIGDEVGCPRRVAINVDSAGNDSTARVTTDGSIPTLAMPAYNGPFDVVLQRPRATLQVQAIAVDSCGAVSSVAKQEFSCAGERLATPRISHWYDFIVFGKKPYDDVVFEGAQLPSGCVVVDIHVELLNPSDGLIEYAYPGSGEATDGNTGARLTAYPPLNGRRLEVRINSWHTFGHRVKYDVVYLVRGRNCVLPRFHYRTE